MRDDGTLDLYGGASSKQQLIYQHASHVGLPVDEVSPIERRQQLDEAIQAAEGAVPAALSLNLVANDEAGRRSLIAVLPTSARNAGM